jgi:segregation and condensation protein B
VTQQGQPNLRAQVEAVLMVVDEPVAVADLAAATAVPAEAVSDVLTSLAAEYAQQGRGFELRCVAGGWRFYSSAACAEVVERFVREGQQARLTQAALETLAIVAYRQPVTRAQASAIRGVSCDAVMRTLVSRGLIEEVGVEHESGSTLFATTSYFLERLGLASLDELPPLAPFLPGVEEVEESGVGV